MNNCINISEFAKLTNTTLKTVMYYHKIGLLKDTNRSDNGYRIYGAEELNRMMKIKQLKGLGLNLKQIKEILGDAEQNKSIKCVLQSLHSQLLNEKKEIEAQISKVETLLSENVESIEEGSVDAETFRSIIERLKPEQSDEYMKYDGLYEQQSSNYRIVDGLNWGHDVHSNYNAIAEFFKDNPDKYKEALEFGKSYAKLSEMSEDDPEIEVMAKEGAEFIKNTPILKELLFGKSGFGEHYEGLYSDMLKKTMSPAHLKHRKLMQEYLEYRP